MLMVQFYDVALCLGLRAASVPRCSRDLESQVGPRQVCEHDYRIHLHWRFFGLQRLGLFGHTHLDAGEGEKRGHRREGARVQGRNDLPLAESRITERAVDLSGFPVYGEGHPRLRALSPHNTA